MGVQCSLVYFCTNVYIYTWNMKPAIFIIIESTPALDPREVCECVDMYVCVYVFMDYV